MNGHVSAQFHRPTPARRRQEVLEISELPNFLTLLNSTVSVDANITYFNLI